MPNYTYENTETGEIFELTMRISERDEFVKENPHLRQLITGAPMIVGGVGSGGVKPGGGLDEVFAKTAEAYPDSPLADRYGKKTNKEIKTREVLKKHKVI